MRRVLLYVYPPMGRSRPTVEYDAIGPFENDAAVDAFLAETGRTDFIKVSLSTPDDTIKYMHRMD